MDSVAVPAVSGLVVAIGFVFLLAAVIDSSISPDIPEEQLRERQNAATAIAMSLPEVRALANNGTGIETDYRWLALDRDRVIVYIVGDVNFDPLYNESVAIFTENRFPLGVWLLDVKMEIQLLQDAVGFSKTESGNKIVTVDINRKTNSVISVEVDSLPDRVTNVKFTEKQRKAIDLVLRDSTVQQLSSKYGYFIQQIRPGAFLSSCSDPDGCILVGLGRMSEPKLGVHTAVIVDVTAGRVLDVAPPLNEQ